MYQLNFIDGSAISIKPYGEGKVTLVYINGEEIRGLSPRRLFSVTHPHSFIQMLDESGQEVGILRDMNQLDPSSYKCLEKALERFYLIPEILEIHTLKEEYRITRWDVTTDKGRRVFDVQSRNTDIKILPFKRVLIRDSDNNLYEIMDYDRLPKKSRALLEGEI